MKWILFMWLNILKFTKTNLAVDFSIGGSRDGQGVQCSRTTVTSEASFVVDSIFHCKLLSFKNGSTTSVIEMSFYHLRVTLLPHLSIMISCKTALSSCSRIYLGQPFSSSLVAIHVTSGCIFGVSWPAILFFFKQTVQ